MFTQPPRVLLLDFDGVVFTDRRMLSRVASRAVRFVHRKVNPGWSAADAARANEFLYKNYGHTWKGLTQIYPGQRQTSLREYNKYVYHDSVIKHARKYKACSASHDLQAIQHVQALCKKHDVPIYIVSNAPLAWVKSLNDAMGIGLPTANLLTCDHEVMDGCLKPDLAFYNKAVLYIRDREGALYSDAEFVVVDDSFYNLMPLVNIPGFAPVWVTDAAVPLDEAKTSNGVTAKPKITIFTCLEEVSAVLHSHAATI